VLPAGPGCLKDRYGFDGLVRNHLVPPRPATAVRQDDRPKQREGRVRVLPLRYAALLTVKVRLVRPDVAFTWNANTHRAPPVYATTDGARTRTWYLRQLAG